LPVFTKAALAEWVHLAVPASVAMASISFVITAVEALSYALFLPRGWLRKLSSFFTTLGYCLLAGLLFAVSLVPYTSLDQETQRELSPQLTRAYSVLSERLHLTSSYGLFRSMTGVGGRPEVVLEGANDVAGPWLEYEFPYKPGSVYRAPPVVAPHQPRLDWQLWFAALGSYNHNPWLLSAAFRLLQGAPEVVRMLDPQSPWRKNPPKFIRAKKFLYSYTSLDDPSGSWWRRREEGEYFPVFTATHPPLLQYLKQVGVLGGTAPNACTNPRICGALDWLYQQHCDLDPVLLLYGVVSAVLIVAWTQRRFRES
ncbi:Lipase maturation factor, partial [Trinorchestia longiramus]